MKLSSEAKAHLQIALIVFAITMSLAFAVSCSSHEKREVVYVPVDTHSIVEVIDPCGPEGDKDEILFRLNTNTIVTTFEGNKNYFMVKVPGQYITRDGTKCTYRIDQDGTVSW